MRTVENRPRYHRSGRRYSSNLPDAEWSLISPLIPPARKGGNKHAVNIREVVNGLMHILSTDCQWSALPKDLPPKNVVNGYFWHWQDDRKLDRVHHALYVACREKAD